MVVVAASIAALIVELTLPTCGHRPQDGVVRTMDSMSDSGKTRAAWGTLSRAAVIDAALHLIEAEGVGALSIRRLAASLGVGRMAIYRHVDSKDALLAAVVNEVAARELVQNEGPPANWKEALRENARRIRTQLLRYPGLGELLIRTGAGGAANRAFGEQLLQIFRRAGFTGDDLAVCYLIYIDTVVGRVARENGGDFIAGERMKTFTDHHQAPVQTPLLAAVARQLQSADSTVLFETMLDVMIAGFAARLERCASQDPSAQM